MEEAIQVDTYNLERFVTAQETVIDQVRAELRVGAKRSHWMWFIFPQIRGLGSSETARYYALSSLEEAKAYLAHPVLGQRLRECTELVMGIGGRTAGQIFGSPDNLKFRSSMTLFARAATNDGMFVEALKKYFGGAEDQRTVELLAATGD